MALVTLFSRPLLRQHRAPLLSQACLVVLLLNAVRLLAPLCAVWASDAFWLKERSFREMPDVHFGRQFVLWAECENRSLAYSSLPALNRAFRQSGHLGAVSVRETETDLDLDRKPDQLSLRLQVPEPVRAFQLVLFFRYRLDSQFSLRMHSLLHLSQHWPRPAQSAALEGDLRLEQRKAFFHKGFDFRYDQPLLPPADAPLHLPQLAQAHASRDYFTLLASPSAHWSPVRALTNRNQTGFDLHVRVRYREQTFAYEAGFWHLLKWALVQYLALFVLVDAVLRRVEEYAFGHWLLPSVAHLPDAALLKRAQSKRH